ncbi:unnamed protein product [Protopolystoma xenopodis]|uniref:Uncharacterized protein n=1 Tax=Protopolystoma xenopodis TaxID=117903 RepID=A0A448XR13_9PLAT|nr:unnamed protein product [Protopolystoma xenopodis]
MAVDTPRLEGINGVINSVHHPALDASCAQCLLPSTRVESVRPGWRPSKPSERVHEANGWATNGAIVKSARTKRAERGTGTIGTIITAGTTDTTNTHSAHRRHRRDKRHNSAPRADGGRMASREKRKHPCPDCVHTQFRLTD